MRGTSTIETRFGSFAVDATAVVAVPDGLPGFERCRHFVIITGPTLEPLTCLQGLDDQHPSFLAVDPRLVVSGYHLDLPPAARHRVEALDDEPLVWLALVRLRDDAAFVNLRAPVVVNPRRMIGVQVIPAESPYSVDHRLSLA